MARYLSSSALIESAKNRAMIPENQVTFKEEHFLMFANEDMDMAVIPYVMSYHEDYFLVSERIPLVDGQLQYEIPYRAIGNKLRDVAIVDNSGTTYEMTRISKGDVSYYKDGSGSDYHTRLKPFYLESNMVVLLKSERIGFLELSYYLRPNMLVAEDRVMTIEGIAVGPTSTTISVNNIPDHITPDTLVDLIQLKSPHKCLRIDVPITIMANSIVIDNEYVPANLVEGDMIAAAEECCIPQIPTDLHSMLAQRIACRCLEAMNDQTGLAAANAKLQEMETKAATLIDARVDDAPFKVLNRFGVLRSFRRYTRY